MAEKVKTVVYNYGTSPLNMVVGAVSVMVSWYFNKSIGWAILHYIFGWVYLLYSLLQGRFADGGFMEIMESYF